MRIAKDVCASALRFVPAFDREIRLDSAETQGAATYWFALSAVDDGEWDLAARYAHYERSEYVRLAKTVLGGWLADLLHWVDTASWSGAQSAHLVRAHGAQTWDRFERLADLALEGVDGAIENRNREWFVAAHRQMREAHIASNDLAVRIIQDLLTAIAAAEGEETLERVLDVSYTGIWKQRYELWFGLSGLERLALSSEGMRAHYAGPGRLGDFEVRELQDKYVMRFDPCGTGQVMRRGDDEREPTSYLPIVELGKTQARHAWAQGQVGMPYYCAHCPALLEHFPTRDFGHVLRPVLFDLNPASACQWEVSKQQ